MKYTIIYEKSCLKFLKKLEKTNQVRIISAINQLPFGDVKKLQGQENDLESESEIIVLFLAGIISNSLSRL